MRLPSHTSSVIKTSSNLQETPIAHPGCDAPAITHLFGHQDFLKSARNTYCSPRVRCACHHTPLRSSRLPQICKKHLLLTQGAMRLSSHTSSVIKTSSNLQET